MSVVRLMRPTRAQRSELERSIESELNDLGTVIHYAEQRIRELHGFQDRLLEMDDQDFKRAYGGRKRV